MGSLPIVVVVLIFAAAAAMVWVAGIALSHTTDILSTRLGLGEAVGGIILLAIATNLPEIAITASAALSHQLSLAVGNILGGVAIQTVVLAFLDVFGFSKWSKPLTYQAASLVLVLEGPLVVAMPVLVVIGTQLSTSVIKLRLTPPAVLLAVVWAAGSTGWPDSSTASRNRTGRKALPPKMSLTASW